MAGFGVWTARCPESLKFWDNGPVGLTSTMVPDWVDRSSKISYTGIMVSFQEQMFWKSF